LTKSKKKFIFKHEYFLFLFSFFSSNNLTTRLIMNDTSNLATWSEKIDWRIRQFRLLKDQHESVFAAIALMIAALKQGNKILAFGNGGSATQCSHFAAELVNKFYFQREGLPALALNTDTACLTSIANDSEFKFIFSRQLQALGKPGDIALGLTTSGKSANVCLALQEAGQMKLITIALCGKHPPLLDGHPLNIDAIIAVPADDTPLIQEIHLFILHIMAEVLEEKMCRGDR
jgi:D-sedoheptulose 7-phosphate isomerase